MLTLFRYIQDNQTPAGELATRHIPILKQRADMLRSHYEFYWILRGYDRDVVFRVHLVRWPLVGQLYKPPDDRLVRRTGGMRISSWNRSNGPGTALSTTDLGRDRTRAAALGKRRLTASGTGRGHCRTRFGNWICCHLRVGRSGGTFTIESVRRNWPTPSVRFYQRGKMKIYNKIWKNAYENLNLRERREC